MDVRRLMSRFGSLSVILVLSLVVLAACGREEDAKPTPTPTGSCRGWHHRSCGGTVAIRH